MAKLKTPTPKRGTASGNGNGRGDAKRLRLDPQNARLHGERNKAAIRKSLQVVGAGRGILADANGIIRAGNGVYEAWVEQGGKVKIVETDGKTLLVTKRTDLRGKDAIRAAALDNIVGESSAYEYDSEILAAIAKDDELVAQLANEDERIAELLRGANGGAQEPQSEGIAFDGNSGLQYRVIIDCVSELQQRELLEKFESEGLTCRALMS